jgi:putative hydrolase of HD superfamily
MSQSARQATDRDGESSLATPVIELGRLALAFGRVDRITYHEDGTTLESDTDHTVMLGLVACSFAQAHFPDLDRGLIAQYALAHDLVEVYAGDTPTLRISADERQAKRDREAEAMLRIGQQFALTLPWVCKTIAGYELKRTPEARYVKAMDKLLPKITHILNNGATFRDQGMSHDELAARYLEQYGELMGYAADFPPLFALRRELLDLVLAGPAYAAHPGTSEPGTAPAATGGHVLHYEIRSDYFTGEIVCHEPDGAPCRLWCVDPTCPNDETGCDHPVGDQGRCLQVEWINNADDLTEVHAPGVTEPIADGMPVQLTWDGDGYTWRGVGSPAPEVSDPSRAHPQPLRLRPELSPQDIEEIRRLWAAAAERIKNAFSALRLLIDTRAEELAAAELDRPQARSAAKPLSEPQP